MIEELIKAVMDGSEVRVNWDFVGATSPLWIENIPPVFALAIQLTTVEFFIVSKFGI